MHDGISLKRKFYPEATIGGFSHVDIGVQFYTRIAALLKPTDRVLDFGAGRGAQILEDRIEFRQQLQKLRGRVARVDGCDLDPAVFDNPFIDEARLIEGPSAPLPYDDATFDLIFCSWVFEHVADPEFTSRELLRILKPGGHICALTPNKWGYLALASRAAGSSNHVKLLKRIQPERKAHDVFPTCYKLNTPAAIRRYFGHAADTVAYSAAGEPAYHFNNPVVFRGLKLLHTVLPPRLRPALLIFIRKHG
ncbi:class I SAM-dependent methyltransferase [Sphingomonas jatrophae]|uniref:Methyltransferase domain-containing protein n=1 Tax=Sphingomonas jatrophae TaxID=1166337 RepID=A0A1I6M5G3_9SPHN|nr:class I SAM-dependent methyltransferase [Sphingomonas jatrophae]SFS10944.1 Methyltransferase domain-containing protein [Sphingomonas jatrophae]